MAHGRGSNRKNDGKTQALIAVFVDDRSEVEHYRELAKERGLSLGDFTLAALAYFEKRLRPADEVETTQTVIVRIPPNKLKLTK